MFGWRSVFGFALLAGGAITLTAYWVLYETHRPPIAPKATSASLQSYVALFRRPRFNAFVLQSGFITGAFMVMASASASLMTELLHRPATEFGLYFLLFPIGFFTGNLIASRVGNRVAGETMILIGSLLGMATVAVQAIVLSHGVVTPLALFIPGFFITMSQGIGMSYSQVGAMAEIPRFAGTAAGVGVFMQNFGAALFSQLYGLLADGTPMPMSGSRCSARCWASSLAPCRSCWRAVASRLDDGHHLHLHRCGISHLTFAKATPARRSASIRVVI